MIKTIELNVNEMLVGTYVGSRRNAEAKYQKRKPRFPEKVTGELWGFHIESACAELAVCKYLGIYWGFGVNTFHVSDVSFKNYEIRHSNRGKLKIRPDDDDDMYVISVSGECPIFYIHGTLKAKDGKQDKWFHNYEPVCYFIPNEELIDIDILKK